VPTYNGLDYLDKPAFFFKAVALSMSAFGQSEAAARLPSALFALATLAIAYAFVRRAFGARCAAFAVMIVATTPLFFAFARIVIFDMSLCFFVCAALFAGYLAEEHEGAARRRWYLCGAAAAGLATLVKGPVGFIVPSLVLSIFHLIERRPRAILRILSPLNLLVFFGLVLPWFLGLVHERPDFAYYGLVLETFKRFTSPVFHRTQPFYYYGPVIAGAFLSWSVLFPESIATVWKARARLSRVERFFVVWAIVVVVFFSISQSKLPGYILSATVALGSLVARLFDRAAELDSRARALVLRSALLLCALCLALAVALAAEAARPGLLPGLFPKARLAAWSPIVVPGTIALCIAALFAFIARVKRDSRAALAAFVAMPLGLVVASGRAFEVYADSHSSRDLARSIEAAAPGASVACLACFPQGLALYLKQPITLISADGGEMSSNYVLYSLSERTTWPPTVVKLEDRDAWIEARSKALVILAHGGGCDDLQRVAALHGGHAIEVAPPWCAIEIDPRGAH
jgi:4-amino-4-deoxy-L-arabinose transferase-like glycosyltransferase